MRRIVVADDRQKLAFMRRNAHRVARSPEIVTLASRLVRPFRPDDWQRQAAELFHFVRDGIRFQRDPDRREQLADPRASLARAFDDCDGKADILMALELAIGMEGDIWPVWRGDELIHVQNGVRWPGSERLANARDGSSVLDGPPGSGWIVSDPTIRGTELGTDPELVPRNPETGKLPLS